MAAIRRPGIAVGSDDDTITGSRDAFAPLLLWSETPQGSGRTGLQRRVAHCLATAEYAEQRLREEGHHPERTPGSNTVLFDAPTPDLCTRWNLLTLGDRAHLIAMPHVTSEHIDRLCADLRYLTLRESFASQAGNPLQVTPHDFRRMFVTEAVTGCLPVHIAARILGHKTL